MEGAYGRGACELSSLVDFSSCFEGSFRTCCSVSKMFDRALARFSDCARSASSRAAVAGPGAEDCCCVDACSVLTAGVAAAVEGENVVNPCLSSDPAAICPCEMAWTIAGLAWAKALAKTSCA